jgi:hypothetical protein
MLKQCLEHCPGDASSITPSHGGQLSQRWPGLRPVCLTADWAAWNATMLPEIDTSYTNNFTGAQLADRIGTPEASHKADNPPPATAPHH